VPSPLGGTLSLEGKKTCGQKLCPQWKGVSVVWIRALPFIFACVRIAFIMQYAVIKAGGKQYKVAPGESIKIEKIKGDLKAGDQVTFEEVLMTANGDDLSIGAPFVKNGKVTGILEEIGRNKKVTVIKYRPKSRYFKKNGHRQPYFKVKIDSIG
jgi:large subunit ribosomal protein L21